MKKLLLLSTSLTTCVFFAPHAMANPEGGVVVGGAATIENGINRVDVHQSTNRAVIDWRSFNIEQGETTQFHQPSSSSLTVNRVNDTNSSRIMGSLKANGNVVVINQSGILFGPSSTVDVNSLIATTSDISNADAMAGNMQFNGAGAPTSAIINEGVISAQEAGLVGLVAPRVENNGVINARLGKVHLASGDRFTVDLYGDGALNIVASDVMQEQLVSNKGKIVAEGGVVQITAAAGAQLVTSVVQLDGEIKAPSAVEQNGRIIISGHDDTAVSITGSLDTSGVSGGDISVTAKNILQQGTITANGTGGKGGNVDIQFKSAYLDSEASKVEAKGTGGDGGNIAVKGKTGSRAFVSGKYDASGTTAKGGKVQITAAQGDLKLYGAKVHADGKTGGGTVQIGGEYQGGGTLEHSLKTAVNFATILSADATDTGKGGDVIVWSHAETGFSGTAYARGGANGGDGGLIELSSKDTLKISDAATTIAAARKEGYQAGQLLLDPKNITIATGGISDGISYFEFLDPNPDAGNFGYYEYTVLSNGNVAISDPLDDLIATNAGAAYLFNGATGALISTLTGSSVEDQVGGGYFIELTNGNYVITTPYWNNGIVVDAGAVTWASATSGVSGAVSTANSFVGGYHGASMSTVTTLTNGNYLVSDVWFRNGMTLGVGAVAWANGNGGTVGVMSAANSLVGSQTGDVIGINNIIPLSNGNYVVISPSWNNGGISNAGAITLGNGNGGTVGAVSAANSLVGTHADDNIGTDEWGNRNFVELSNGSFLVGSYRWDDGVSTDVGAVTFINGTTGLTGTLSAANSIVGSVTGDLNSAIYNLVELGNGNFAFAATEWDDGGTVDVGAVIMGNISTGLAFNGLISATNSLVGSTAGDRIGSGDGAWGQGLYALTNDNFVVVSSLWDNGVIEDAGAVTWVDGTTGLTGVVSAANSLVGSTDFDQIGYAGVVALSNGNYVVGSSLWDNGVIEDAGASTWVNGATGLSGAISSANSIIGSSEYDNVGGVIELASGNYLLLTSLWDDGATADVGAVTLVDGATGLTGFVTTANSIVGTTAGDQIGSNGAISVGSGNFVINSPNWDNGAVVDSGAVTWLQESAGTSGVVSTANSLYSLTNDSFVGGSGTRELSNGNYLVFSGYWDNGAAADAGAITWGSGNTGITGAISASNSLIGSSTGDRVGDNPDWSVLNLANGNYIALSLSWDNGSIIDAGAVTVGNSTTGTSGVIDASNSVVGSHDNDQIGWQDWGQATVMDNGDYILHAIYWDNGALEDAGAVMVIDGTNGTFGEITSYNAILGTVAYNNPWPSYNGDENGRYVFTDGTLQKAYSIELGTHEVIGSYNAYSDMAGSDVTLSPDFITQVLNTGTSVTLQANNDITLNNDLIVSNSFGDGGTLTFQAGRSILLNADIFTDNGDLNLFANEDLSTGVVNAHRDAGAAVITMAAGASINAGTGAVNIRLDDGTGKTNATAGSITLRDITAGTIFARNMNASGDVIVQSGTLSASEAGDAITLVSGRNFINNSGAGALDATTGRWLVYSTNPSADTIGSLANDFRRFSCTYGGSCPAMPGGTNNGFLYSYTPILTVTPDALAAIQYGDAIPSLTGYSYSLADYLGGDAGDDVIGGSVNGSTTYTVGSGVNSYNVNYASGALTSAMGYGFNYLNNTTAITVNKKDITASFSSALTKIYGNANPTVNYSNFTFTGLVGSDSSSLFTSVTPNFGAVDANTDVSVGNVVTATIGSTANYNVTNTPSTTLSITPRALTVTTNSTSKILPAADPTFSGSNNLTAHDAGLISWVYAPQGYIGLDGSYTIEATATDVSGRLANYTRTNTYGTFIVHPLGTVITPPSTEVSDNMPDTVTYMSLGGYLRDIQSDSSTSVGSKVGSSESDEVERNDESDIGNQLISTAQEGDGEDVQKTGNDFIGIHPTLKKFLMNPFAMLVQE